MTRCLLFFLLAFQVNISSASICDPEVVDRLNQLGIPITVENNKLLLQEIESRNGVDVTTELLKQHPALLSDKSILDIKTLEWVLAKIEDINLPCYIYSPFTTNFDTLNSELFSILIQKEPATYPIFMSENHFSKFKDNLATNRDLNIMVFASIHKLEDEQAIKLYDEFVEKFTQRKYVKFTNENHKHPMVHIVGHGASGDDAIYNGEGSHLFTFEVMDQLKKMNIPNDSVIKLDFC